MRILVTGCAGFIGSHLLEHLFAAGHEVLGIDNFSACHPDGRASIEQQLDALASAERFNFLQADLTETATYERIPDSGPSDFDAVVHLASCNLRRGSKQSPSDFVPNVLSTQRLLEFCKTQDIPQFIFASSSLVYGNHPQLPWKESLHPVRPLGPFAQSKLCCENLGRAYSNTHGLRFIALRIFTTYGPRQLAHMALCQFAKCIANNQAVVLNGNGETRRDYVYIDDLVRGITAALDYDQSNYEVINLGSSQSIELQEVILELESILGVQADIEHGLTTEEEPIVTHACLEKAARLLKYQASTTFDLGMREFAEWFFDSKVQVGAAGKVDSTG